MHDTNAFQTFRYFVLLARFLFAHSETSSIAPDAGEAAKPLL